METVSITSLTPAESIRPNTNIRAVVTLIWPYSSSTRQCALLLADPDFRLRNHKGQVRVRFTGASAQAIANVRVGIGDEVLLELRGATWAGESSNVSTPGKSVDGELLYRGELGMRIVSKASGEQPDSAFVQVNESTPPPAQLEQRERRLSSTATPARATPSYLRHSLGGADVVPIYSSPAFVRRLRLSAEGSNWDPFADVEAELEERPVKKQRVSFGQVGRWKLAGRTPSPEREAPRAAMHFGREHVDVDTEVNVAEAQATSRGIPRPGMVQQDLQTEASPDAGRFSSGDANDASAMLPPPLPRLQMPENQLLIHGQTTAADEEDGPSTPKLQPIPSSALPLPSPFPYETPLVQFGAVDTGAGAGTEMTAVGLTSPTVQRSLVSGREAEAIERSGHIPFESVLSQEHRAVSFSTNASFTELPAMPMPGDVSVDSLASTVTNIREDSELREVERDGPYTQHFTRSQIADLSDTEEDEDMYPEHLRRRQPSEDARDHGQANADRQEEAIDDEVLIVEEDDVEEVIEDMGEPPEESSEDEEERIAAEDTGEEGGDEDEFEGEEDEVENGTEPKAPETVARLQQGGEISVTASRPVVFEAAASSKAATEAHLTKDPIKVHTGWSLPPPTPQTSIRQSASLFSIDGASDGHTSTSPKRQAKLDRVMAKTYGSLFGFRVSPSPERPQQPQPRVDRQSPTPGTTEKPSSQRAGLMEHNLEKRAMPEAMDSTRSMEAGSSSMDPKNVLEAGVDVISNISPAKETHAEARRATVEPEKDASVMDAALTKGNDARNAESVQDISKELSEHDHALQSDARTMENEFISETSNTRNIPAVADPEEEVSMATVSAIGFQTEQNNSGDVVAHSMDRSALTASREDPAQRPGLFEVAPVPEDNEPWSASRGDVIAPVLSPSLALVRPPTSSAPRPRQVEVIDLGSSDVEDEEEEEEGEEEERDHLPAGPLQNAATPDDATPSPAVTQIHLFEPMGTGLGTQHPPSVRTQDSQGSALQSDMLDTTQTTVDRSEVHTPLAQHEDLIIPETVADEGMPWHAPGQQSFFTDHLHPQELETPVFQPPLIERTTVTLTNDYRDFELQSATSVATDNTDNLPTSAPPSPSHAQDASVEYGSLNDDDNGMPSRATLSSARQPQNLEVDDMLSTATPLFAHQAEHPETQAETAPDQAKSSGSPDRTSPLSVEQHLSVSMDVDETPQVDETAQVDMESHPPESRPAEDTEMGGFGADQSPALEPYDPHAQLPEVIELVSSPVHGDTFSANLESSRATAMSTDAEGQAESHKDQANEQTKDSRPQFAHEQALYTHLPPSPQDSQEQFESQPFETQVQTRIPFPPTPQLTQGDSLLNQMTTNAEHVTEESPAPEHATPRRSRKSRSISRETSLQPLTKPAPVRRSPRKSHAGSRISEEPEEEQEVQATSQATGEEPTTSRRIRKSKESATAPKQQDKTPVRRSTRMMHDDNEVLQELDDHSQPVQIEPLIERPATPEQQRDASVPADEQNFLSPSKKAPVRRSARKMQNVDGIPEQAGAEPDNITAALSTAKTSQKRSVSNHREDYQNNAQVPEADDVEQSSQTRMPARRSLLRTRFGQVPEAIASWFSPRRSTRSEPEAKEPEASPTADEAKPKSRRPRRSTGFATDAAYYMPLSNIDEKLNPANGDGPVDIMAVVTDGTKPPERAAKGPRDHLTFFRIKDISIEEGDSIRVDVFRPWAAMLPVAQIGDVVLLRSFHVKSRRRKAYLMSGNSSAWCVWRYAAAEAAATSTAAEQESEEVSGGSRPAWAQRAKRSGSLRVDEEVKGPPVELGTQERERAEALRGWWLRVKDNPDVAVGSSSQRTAPTSSARL